MKRFIRAIAYLAVMSVSVPAVAETLHGTLYKDQSCPCCGKHAAYLKQYGIDLVIKPLADIASFSKKAGIPPEYKGCHTIMLDGYAIEGHVTIDIIRKLLRERPSGVIGISLPGNPQGVPGLDGPKEGSYTVYAISKDGRATPFATQ